MSMTKKNSHWNELIELIPVGKDYLWGGVNLINKYNKNLDVTPLAESWECSTHLDGLTKVANKAFEGMSLREFLNRHPEFIGYKKIDKGLSFLVKLIDAKDSLSIQVHPDDDFARLIENENNGKAEVWFILDAKPGAKIIYGFNRDCSKDEFLLRLKSGDLLSLCNEIPVKKGDSFSIYPGTVHAIGAGVILAEVQQSSNLTYRIYDYNRKDKDNNFRELHLDKAIEVLNYSSEKNIKRRSKIIRYGKGFSKERIFKYKNAFVVERWRVRQEVIMENPKSRYGCILCIDGQALLRGKNTVLLDKGKSVFIPSYSGEVQIDGDVEFLFVYC